MTPTDRCKFALEIPLPPGDQHVDEVLVLQCTKKPGHKPPHRTEEIAIPWYQEELKP